MKKLASFTALMGLGIALAAPAAADGRHHTVCLQSSLIDRTTVVNPQEILFRMKDGKTWSSKLRSPCLGLRFDGFVYETSTEEICGGVQPIRVLRSNQVCVLGPFEAVHIGQHAG